MRSECLLRFLRGHDSFVCCFALSSCGKLLASGQKESERYKGSMAPVILWSWSGKVLGQFSGLTGSVVVLAFSPDSRFLAASGSNSMLYIWELESGDVLCVQRTDKVPIDTDARVHILTLILFYRSLLAWSGVQCLGDVHAVIPLTH